VNSRGTEAQMKRPVEIASGIGVFVTSVLNLTAIFKMIFDYQQSTHKVALISVISLGVMGLAVFLSFIGAFILLSWANKPT
jgi:Na+-transporting NADH:ubiquinone oxidoreductase subunit NqrE